jgi:hypothetical protein
MVISVAETAAGAVAKPGVGGAVVSWTKVVADCEDETVLVFWFTDLSRA